MIIFKNCSKRELDENQLKSVEGGKEREREQEIPFRSKRRAIAFVWSELMELGEW